VLFVVFYHATRVILSNYQFYSFGGLLSWGFSGVHIFFVLSGFIICFIHFSDIDKPNRAGRYFYKRFSRIYPVYWLVLLFFIPSYLSSVNSINFYYLFDNITLFRTSNHGKIIVVAWTLSHEILFYAVFLILILNRIVGSIFVFFCGFLMIYYVVTGAALMPPYTLSKITGIDYGAFTNMFRLASNPINALFAIGVLSYLVTKLLLTNPHRDAIAKTSIASGIVLFVIASILWLSEERDYTKWASFNLIFGLSAFFLMVGSVSQTMENWASKQSFLLLLGNASYSIYLTHYSFQKLIADYIGKDPVINLNLLSILLIVLPIIVGLAFYRIVELPLLNFFWRRQKTCSATDKS